MTSQLRILGCSGGIGQGLRTTSLLLDNDVLIDAGTGVSELSITEMTAIDTIFLTHSHLDHITCLPLLLDTVGAARTAPVKVFGLQHTIDALRQHIFNNEIWPDFTRIPSAEKPFLSMHPLSVGEQFSLGSRLITALPAKHSVPAVGYAISTETSTIAFTGDSGPCDDFWDAINTYTNLKHLLIETSFRDEDLALAKLSGHYCPQSLADSIRHMHHKIQIWISHLKPGQADQIMLELNKANRIGILRPNALQTGQTLSF